MNDLERLKGEYAERQRRFAGRDLYSWSNPAYRFMKERLQKDVLKVLPRHHQAHLESLHMLEVGCGNGNVLMDFHRLGVSSENLFGVDLLPMRLQDAHESNPLFPLTCADGQRLPYPAGAFDIVMQFTAFSSVLDLEIKNNMAFEMRRVLKPEGVILWYDFWLNPLNRHTRGIRPAEIRQLFPDCTLDLHKVTLAPPLTRRLVPFLSGFALFLERLRFLNTHYLVTISPKREISL
jgi:ubiquinone/menaquinone biosynthesis C-methylase UbiE